MPAASNSVAKAALTEPTGDSRTGTRGPREEKKGALSAAPSGTAIDALSRVSSALCARSATDTASSFMRAVLAASIVMRPAPSVRTVIKSSYAAPDCSDSRTASFIVSTAMA